MSGGVLIRGARLVDGTGAPWRRADVRVAEGRIAAVGADLAAGDGEVVDAEERYLAPGFIDAHCHDDLVTLRDPQRPEKILQGVTTVVVGNCSFSLYPATDASRSPLARHFGSLLGETRAEEIFADFDGYRRRIAANGAALNVVSLVGHAALRLAVVGFEMRPATEGERRAMQALLARQLAQGAAGLSLGLVYPPSAYADGAELVALAETTAAHGKLLAAHVRSYEAELGAAVDEFLDVLRASGCAGLLSHLQSAGRPNWGAVAGAVERLERARAEGVDVAFDMYPYLAGSSTILQLLPPEAQAGGVAGLLARLDDSAERAKWRAWVESETESRGRSKVALIGWENVQLCAIESPALKRLEGQNMVEAARAFGVAPFDLLVRLVRETAGGAGVILFQLDERDVRCACSHRLHMYGSDGLPRAGAKPHPRAFGAFPRALGRLSRAGWHSLEDAVRRCTAAPASRFGLTDRGLVRPGMVADLTLFDADIRDNATFDQPTLPPTGVNRVWVGGECVVRNGAPTGALPGRVIPEPA